MPPASRPQQCFQTPTMLPEPDHAWRTLHLPNPATLPKPNNGFRTQSLPEPNRAPEPNNASKTQWGCWNQPCLQTPNHDSRPLRCLQNPTTSPEPNYASRTQQCFQNPTVLSEISMPPDMLKTDAKTILVLAQDVVFPYLLPVTFGLPCLSEGHCKWAMCVDLVRFQET